MAKPKTPIRAYHGSAAKFDQFDSQFLGTGTGESVHGPGHNFAEHEPTAESYRRTVAAVRMTPEEHARELWRKATLARADKDPAKATLDALDDVDGRMEAAIGIPSAEEFWESVQRSLYDLDHRQPLPERAPGYMYEVDVDADPESFLQWRKPLAEQPYVTPDMLGSIEREMRVMAPQTFAYNHPEGLFGPDKRSVSGRPVTGQDLFYEANRHAGSGDKGRLLAAEVLADHGITGTAVQNEHAMHPSQNLVVFPSKQKLITILRRYGLLPPVLAAGAESANADSPISGLSN